MERFGDKFESTNLDQADQPEVIDQADNMEKVINFLSKSVDEPKRFKARVKVKMESGEIVPNDLFIAEAGLLNNKSGEVKKPYLEYIDTILRYAKIRIQSSANQEFRDYYENQDRAWAYRNRNKDRE